MNSIELKIITSNSILKEKKSIQNSFNFRAKKTGYFLGLLEKLNKQTHTQNISFL